MSDEFDTEISSCPEGWEVKKLGEILRVKRGKRLVRRELSTRGLYPVYQNSLAPLGFFESYNCDAQSAFIIAAGNAGEVGYSNTAFWAADDCFYFTDCKDLHQKFLYYTLLHNQFYIYSQTRRTSIPRLSQDVVANMLIPFPPLHEQQAIADTLTVFDTHITNLAELIAKKKAIRDGALEDLMSGRTRLKGFSGEWTVKKLGECVTILQGGTPSTLNRSYWGGDIVWVTPSEITALKSMYISDSERKITRDGLIHSSATLVPAGTILLCSRATIGELAIATRQMTTNQGFKNLLCKENIYNVFLAYLLLTLKKKLISLANGTTFLELSKQNLTDVEIPLPPLDEQQAIAETLTAFDDEIASLEAERSKIIQIRDGAMNDLLTGKVRLVHH